MLLAINIYTWSKNAFERSLLFSPKLYLFEVKKTAIVKLCFNSISIVYSNQMCQHLTKKIIQIRPFWRISTLPT